MSALPIDLEQLRDEFEQRRRERLLKGWSPYQPRNPIASDLVPCLRYQVGRIIAWELRPIPDAEGLQAMEQGEIMERHVRRQLQDEGWEMIQDQARITIRQPLRPGGPPRLVLSGRIDGKIKLPSGDYIPTDIKHTNEWTYQATNTAEDLDRSIWTRKWKHQLLTYSLADGDPLSCLYVTSAGKRKPIFLWLYDHLELAEDLLQLCVRAVQLVDELEAEEVSPDQLDAALTSRDIPYSPEWETCKRCWLKDRVCFPPEAAQLETPVQRPDLEERLARFAELRPLSSEYERLRKDLKELSEGVDTIIAGKWILEGEWKKRGKSQFWRFGVRRVGERA